MRRRQTRKAGVVLGGRRKALFTAVGQSLKDGGVRFPSLCHHPPDTGPVSCPTFFLSTDIHQPALAVTDRRPQIHNSVCQSSTFHQPETLPSVQQSSADLRSRKLICFKNYNSAWPVMTCNGQKNKCRGHRVLKANAGFVSRLEVEGYGSCERT